MQVITAEQVKQALVYPDLIAALDEAFTADITVPTRQHYDMANSNASRETTLLMMPAWQAGNVAGVKLVTVAPENSAKDLPSIQGTYLLFNIDNGALIAMMDAPTLTAKRTAAASALASRYLSRENSNRLLMIGTGTLAPELIAAHASVRPINQVLVWGRSQANADRVIAQVKQAHPELVIDFTIIDQLESAVAQADIISCATLSQQPLILGEWLQSGQHLDMVGAYRPDMREMDDLCLLRSKLFVDNFATAIKETGDLAIPLAEGVIKNKDIHADLFALARKETQFARTTQDITVFKSVGHALEDLAAAKLVAQQCIEK